MAVTRIPAFPLAPANSAGEEEAARELAEFESIYEQHFAFVWRSLKRLGVSDSALDDATQDVFIVALRRRGDFRGQSSYRTWLFGIATNVARDQRRKKQRVSLQEELDPEVPATGLCPADRLEQREALRLVESFLERLDDGRRAIFIMTELERMPAPEIAQVLGIKLNTVYSRLRSAREAFAAWVKKHGSSL